MKLHLTKTTRFAFLVVFYLTHNLLIGQTQIAANQPSQTSTLQQRNSELSQNSNTENQSPFEAVKGKREDLKKRDLYSKHYINGDGSFTALIGAGPIHYEKNGQFLDINHTIEPQMDVQFPYANTTNLFSSHFGATAHTGVKNRTVEGEITEFLNTKMYWEVNGQAVNTVQSANQPVRIAGDKAYYDNLYGSIAAEFTTLTGKRKLNYIIPNQQALGTIPTNADFLVFSEDVVLPFGWTYSNTEFGISIRNQFGTEIYLYDNPTSTDANSEGLFNEENTIFETLLLGNTLTIKTKVKTSWLLSSDRQFPVMVDPTVSVNTINSQSTGQVWPTGGGYGNPYVGYNTGWYRSWVTFNLSSLPPLSKGSVTSVSTSLYVRAKLGTAGTYTVRIGHSKFDLASTTYFPTFSSKYNGITDPVNAAGAYGEIPMSATLNQYAIAALSIDSFEIIEEQTGTANAFFPISLSPSWGSGTTNRGIGFYGHDDATRKPILTITYSESDIHCRSTHTSSNCAGYGDCQYIGISNVSIGSINNTTPFNNAPNGYNNYSNQITDVSEGTTYNLNVTYKDNGGNSGQLAAWVDWNGDGDFNDANEFLGSFNNRTNNQISTFSFNVPGGTTAGNKRLRIRSVYQGEGLGSTDACTTKQYGETEDYSLNVVITSGMPNNIVFYNYGGDDQLAFNNSRIETNIPTFRMSHQEYDATDYEIQIANNTNFTGAVSQTFTGSYPMNTEANFAFNINFTPTNNTTYYVRARVKGAANVWSAWTTETYSFTYQTPKETPDWFQTTQAQFASNTLSGVEANASHNVVTGAGGNMVTNGDFTSGNTTGWTITGTGSGKSVDTPNNIDAQFPGRWLRMGSISFGTGSSGTIVVAQSIDLTNVSTITFDSGNYFNVGGMWDPTPNTKAEFKIGGTLNDTNGTIALTVNQMGSGQGYTYYNHGNRSVDVSSYTGIQVVKFVMTYNSNWHGNGSVYFVFDNITANAPPSGTITSTPIHLASVQGATAYEGITWNQTLGVGDFTLKVQQSVDGISGWTDVVGFDNISEAGDGEKTFDLSGMTAYPHIRLVGTLDGENVVLHDWSVQFQTEELDCSIETIWNGTSWSNGIPDELTKRIIFDGNYTSDTNNTNGGALVGCSIEVQSGNVVISSNHHITIENEIVVSGGSFTLENNANLVQNSVDAVNVGNITVKRISAPMIRQDATGWSSPVAGQNVRNFSNGTLKKRYYVYNGYGDAGTSGSSFKGLFEYDALYPMPNPIPAGWEGDKITVNGRELFNEINYTFQKGWGYSIRVPNTWSSTNPATFEGVFTGVPQNGDFDVTAYGKYSMVGNPYPSSINANSFLTDNPSVETLHFWTHYYPVGHTSYDSNYATYTLAGGAGNTHPDQNADIPNGIIPIGQGFVIQNLNNIPEESDAPWNVSFKNSMRTTASNGIFYKTDDEFERHRFWLSLKNLNDEKKLAQILVAYMTDATQGYDHQIDGRRMGGAALYSLIDSLDFTVQGRSLPFELEDVVPLGFKSFSDSKYAISIDDVDGFFAEGEVQIFIRDKFLSIEHNLSSSNYEFESVEGEFLNRFEIIYKTEEVLDTEENLFNAIQIYHEGANIMVKSSKEKILSVELWDISGRKLHQNQKVNSHLYSIPKSNFGTQVLLVTVMTENGEITRKKIINS